VGETRDDSKEFLYDFSYWSVDPRDQHFTTQELVCVCVCVDHMSQLCVFNQLLMVARAYTSVDDCVDELKFLC